ncbi:MAG: hypothetical protein QG597_2271 [Actinomycetota bacterium]|nr:hypothetical protein [Actinomycetota bacterium]
MSTDKFAMEPESTLDGLMTAGQERTAALSAGLPAIPAGNYTTGYAAALAATLTTRHAEVSEKTITGIVTATSSVSSTEIVEGESASALTT